MALAPDAAMAARPRLRAGWLSADEAATARPLRAWSLAQRQALADAIAGATATWAAQWDAPGTFEVHADDVAADPGAWKVLDAGTGADLRWHLAGASTPREALLAALFGERGHGAAEGRLADTLVERAWQDWCVRVAALFPEVDTPGDVTPRPLDGRLQVQLAWLGGSLSLAIGGSLAASWMAAQGAGAPRAPISRDTPASLLGAMDAQPVAVRVELRPIAVDLDDLLGLRHGDTFCTGHRLDTPLAVRAAGGDGLLCAAHLGARDGWLAVELARS